MTTQIVSILERSVSTKAAVTKNNNFVTFEKSIDDIENMREFDEI